MTPYGWGLRAGHTVKRAESGLSRLLAALLDERAARRLRRDFSVMRAVPAAPALSEAAQLLSRSEAKKRRQDVMWNQLLESEPYEAVPQSVDSVAATKG